MQSSNAPVKLKLPFASSGGKNTIPNVSQIGILAGAASYPDGFPPLTRTPLVAGGVPPSGLDMNGVLFEMTAIARWLASGAGFAYDGAWAADSNVGGYPKGARVMRSDGVGYWLNTAENNTTDPEAGGAGWVPDFVSGSASITMTGSNVTLTPLEYGKPIIVITGTLTANLNLIFPNLAARWVIINDTTGAFSITCKTAAGTGVAVTGTASIVGDGTNIRSAGAVDDASETVKGIVEIATSAEAQAFAANKVIDGAKLAAAFQGSNQILNAAGYQKLPGGLIIQWGTVTINMNVANAFVSQSITWPIAFPNSVFFATAGPDNGVQSNGYTNYEVTLRTLVGGVLRAASSAAIGNLTYTYVVIGK